MDIFFKILDTANSKQIDIEAGYLVWHLRNGGEPVLCLNEAQPTFPESNDAFAWAYRHTKLKGLFITGPNGRFSAVPDEVRSAGVF
jgi:hypothetical protein